MRLFEFDSNIPALPNLLTVLQHYIERISEEGSEAKFKTVAVINAVKNTGAHFDYETLVAANEEPAVQELIKNFNQDEITLMTGDASTDMTTNTQGDAKEPADTVASTAASAATKSIKKGTLDI